MKQIRTVCFFGFAMLVSHSLLAQVTELDNFTIDNTDYLGWDVNTGEDLNIEHKNNGPLINFLTNGWRRMMINSGGAGGVQGYIGVGNALNTAFVPQQRLHLHQGNDNNDNFIRWSNGDIGNMTGLIRSPRLPRSYGAWPKMHKHVSTFMMSKAI